MIDRGKDVFGQRGLGHGEQLALLEADMGFQPLPEIAQRRRVTGGETPGARPQGGMIVERAPHQRGLSGPFEGGKQARLLDAEVGLEFLRMHADHLGHERAMLGRHGAPGTAREHQRGVVLAREFDQGRMSLQSGNRKWAEWARGTLSSRIPAAMKVSPRRTARINSGSALVLDSATFGGRFMNLQRMLLSAPMSLGALAVLAACGTLPEHPASGVVQVPSPNHNARRPGYVILHHTSNTGVGRALATLTDPASEVSAHYLIGRDGRLYQLVDETQRAWHAGQSWWGGLTDLNSASIGIELDNDGEEPYAEAQIQRLLALLDDLESRYRIPASNVLGHGDIAPRRKADPGPRFPWARLAQAGFGLWCGQAVPVADAEPLPETALALAAIGYDVSDPAAALAAFRRHFLGIEAEGEASDAERRLMRCLVAEKQAPRP